MGLSTFLNTFSLFLPKCFVPVNNVRHSQCCGSALVSMRTRKL
jgi:hypothetical protein